MKVHVVKETQGYTLYECGATDAETLKSYPLCQTLEDLKRRLDLLGATDKGVADVLKQLETSQNADFDLAM